MQEILVPEAGESVTEADIVSWYKASGDYVEQDEALLELETDKASMEMMAEQSGILTISIEEGTVQVGDKLGFIRYSSNQEEVFLGHSVSQQTNISDETARIIDSEVKALVKKGEASAKKIINAKLKDLHIIAKGLLEFETLTATEIKDLLKGKKIVKEDESKESDTNNTDNTENKKTDGRIKNKPIGSVPLTIKNTS